MPDGNRGQTPISAKRALRYLVLDSLEEPEPLEPEAPVALGVEVVPEDVLSDEALPVLPDEALPVLAPEALCSRWHCSSAAPASPTHFVLESAAPADVPPALELSAPDDPPELMPGLAVELGVEEPAELVSGEPAAPLLLPCAQEAVAKASMAAVSAALSAFSFIAGFPLG